MGGVSRASKERARAKEKAKQKEERRWVKGLEEEEGSNRREDDWKEVGGSGGSKKRVRAKAKTEGKGGECEEYVSVECKGKEDEEEGARVNDAMEEERRHKKKKKGGIGENEKCKNVVVKERLGGFVAKVSIFPTIGEILQIPECLEQCKEEDMTELEKLDRGRTRACPGSVITAAEWHNGG